MPRRSRWCKYFWQRWTLSNAPINVKEPDFKRNFSIGHIRPAMSGGSYDAVAEKILLDLEFAIKKYQNINEFYIIPTPEEENKNSSPIIKGESTLGLESWTVTHIYPFAHHQIMQKNNYRTQNLSKVIPCLTGVALLNPEMPTVWNRRRELIISKKLHVDNELRLTRMALSRKPKCNDVLAYRRWIIENKLKQVQDLSNLLEEELRLSEMIANRYHSNYHAWSHRIWSLQHLLPESPFLLRKKPITASFFETASVELAEVMTTSISKSEFSYIKNSKIFHIYFEELENNFKWISSHVSDHSGLHFRKFLIMEIISFVTACMTFSNKMELQNELDCNCMNSQCHFVMSTLSNGKENMTEFLGSFNLAPDYKKVVEDYLFNLGQELTPFDLAMFLIVTELKSNSALCLLYFNHEALWCYRRFLIFIYKHLIDALDSHRINNVSRQFLHLDKNGVPYKKDLKYESAENSEIIPEHSHLYIALCSRLVSSEEELISKINSQDEHMKSLVTKYALWLKKCFDIGEKFMRFPGVGSI